MILEGPYKGLVPFEDSEVDALLFEVEVETVLLLQDAVAGLEVLGADHAGGADLEAGASVEDVWPHAVERTHDSVIEWLAVREEETG